MATPELDLKKVNLQAAVGYLISLHDNEVDWNLLGIKVIGHIDALPIPEGTYEYGDAYEVGTEPPYDLHIYTRPDGKVHTEGDWFPVGKFPMPGPQGPKGDGLEQISRWTNGTVSNVNYDTTDGAKVSQTTTVQYKDSTDGSTKYKSFGTTTTLPIAPGDEYLTMNTDADNTIVQIKVDKPSLALDFYQVAKPSDGSTSVPAWDGTKIVSIPYNKNEYAPLKNALVKTGNRGEMSVNRIYFPSVNYEGDSSAFVFSGKTYGIERMFLDLWTKDLEITTSSSDSGTLSAGDLWRINNAKNINILYRGYSHIRQSPVKSTGIIRYVSTECDNNTITVRNFLVNAQSGTWTWTETSFYPTYKHVTQMHVVIPGDDDYYLTIFNTDKHGAMYNLNSASTLLDNIGTAGTIAYKQNTANAAYIPIQLSKNASGNWEWNMGSASGTFTTNQIDTITDDYETIG